MLKLFAAAVFAISSMPALAATLTAQETRWLQAAEAVLVYSQKIKLPVDISVRVEGNAGHGPMSMGFDRGRCKLVLTMRGNPDAEKTLANVPAAEQDLLIEAMAAHEIAHCWRYAQGTWHSLPAGFVETGVERADDPSMLVAAKQMRENRREEGFADLAALAWVQRFHPAEYGRVYAWLEALRSHPPAARSAHDTRAWVRLGRDGATFAQGASPFEAAGVAWSAGLLSDD